MTTVLIFVRLGAEMFQGIDDAGVRFRSRPKVAISNPARASVFSLHKHRSGKVLRQRRLADPGQAVETMIGGSDAVVRKILVIVVFLQYLSDYPRWRRSARL